jgi:hypothetical protein
MSATEILDRSRRRMLVAALVGFGLWQSSSIAESLLGSTRVPRALHVGLLAISVGAGALWTVQVIQMVRWIRRVRADQESAAALNDERVEQARLRAFSLAFFAVMGVQAILIIASIPAVVAAQLTILVGFSSAIVGFLIFERE